jgi:hypothetical protein
MLLAVIPLPRPDMMPPVTTTYCESARPITIEGEERAPVEIATGLVVEG